MSISKEQLFYHFSTFSYKDTAFENKRRSFFASNFLIVSTVFHPKIILLSTENKLKIENE